MKTLDEQRRDTADRLTTDTGFEVSWMGSCFSLWDGSNRWFPLYTVAQVLNRAGRLKARRDLVEPTPESEAFEAESDRLAVGCDYEGEITCD